MGLCILGHGRMPMIEMGKRSVAIYLSFLERVFGYGLLCSMAVRCK
jgi:hypothetical protein